MSRQGTKQDQYLAWVLNKEYGYNISRIARYMGWGVTTVRTWVQTVDYLRQIQDLKKELETARKIAHVKRENL